MLEIWRPVEGFPLYEVSDLGRVRNARTGKMLKQRLNGSGYPIVDLNSGKRYGLSDRVRLTTKTVHSLVCRAFHGAPPTAKHEVAHRNGNRSDARARNLRWATRSSNHAEKLAHGTNNHGEANGSSKLTEAKAMAILSDARVNRVIAVDYGISAGQVQKIKSGAKWAHLQMGGEVRILRNAFSELGIPWRSKASISDFMMASGAGQPLNRPEPSLWDAPEADQDPFWEVYDPEKEMFVPSRFMNRAARHAL